MEAVQFDQEDVSTSLYGEFGLEPLSIFHLGTSKLLKERNLTYIESDARCRHP